MKLVQSIFQIFFHDIDVTRAHLRHEKSVFSNTFLCFRQGNIVYLVKLKIIKKIHVKVKYDHWMNNI